MKVLTLIVITSFIFTAYALDQVNKSEGLTTQQAHLIDIK